MARAGRLIGIRYCSQAARALVEGRKQHRTQTHGPLGPRPVRLKVVLLFLSSIKPKCRTCPSRPPSFHLGYTKLAAVKHAAAVCEPSEQSEVSTWTYELDKRCFMPGGLGAVLLLTRITRAIAARATILKVLLIIVMTMMMRRGPCVVVKAAKKSAQAVSFGLLAFSAARKSRLIVPRCVADEGIWLHCAFPSDWPGRGPRIQKIRKALITLQLKHQTL